MGRGGLGEGERETTSCSACKPPRHFTGDARGFGRISVVKTRGAKTERTRKGKAKNACC